MIHFKTKLVNLSGLILLFYGCSSVKNLSEGEYLLVNSKIIENNQTLKNSPLNFIVTTKPNKKIFGIPLGLQVHNLAKQNTDSIFEKWLLKKKNREKKMEQLLSYKQIGALKKYVVDFNKWLKKSGEPPVLLNQNEVEKSIARMVKYYKNLGYFDVSITADTLLLKNKKAAITYNIETKKKYYIDSISKKIKSNALDSIYSKAIRNSLIKKGMPFEVKKFEEERKRLINLFMDNGIYNFQQNSLSFTAAIDSTGKDQKIPIIVNIGNFQKRINDTLREFDYSVHNIKAISIYLETKNNLQQIDAFTDSIKYDGYKIYSKGKLKYKPRALTSGIFIKKNKPYSEQDRTATYRYFSNLRNFKYPSIVYAPIKEDSTDLEAAIILTPKERFSIGFDLDFSHSNIQDFGIGLGGVVGIRNVFKETEQLELSIKNTLGTTSRELTGSQDNFFNIFEVGADVKLILPRILSPVSTNKIIPKGMYPQTQIVIGASLQKNIGLDKELYTGKYEFNWTPKKGKKITLKLIDLEFVNNKNVSNYFNVYRNSYDRLNNIATDINNNLNNDWFDGDNLSIPDGANAFIDAVLNNQTELQIGNNKYKTVNNINERLERLTANNLILGSSFNLNINNQENILDENFYQFRWKIDWVGNILNGFLQMIGNEKNDSNQYQINGVIPSQYIKTEIDFIKHWSIGRKRIIALRVYSGMAIPYGNINNMPFSRSFFAGGANDNRAWRAYKLGPGSSNNINEFNEANLKLGMNLEFRMLLLGKLNGALFIDMGNIWNIFDNVEDPKMRFNGIQDLKEIGIGTGLGLRYDFDFIVFRFDVGFKSYNPSLPENRRWWTDHSFSKAVYNIGINYPF